MSKQRNLKNTQKIVVENFKRCNKDREVLKLLGNESIQKESPLDVLDTFNNVFGLNNCFYYFAQELHNEKSLDGEIGLAHLEETDEGIVLVRERCCMNLFEGQPVQHKPQFNGFEPTKPDSELMINNFTPNNFADALVHPNSIITCREPFVPESLFMHDNSVLVCVKGVMRSVTFDEFTKLLRLK